MKIKNFLKEYGVLVCILVAAVALSLTHITWGLPNALHRWPFHPDEGVVLLALKSMDVSKAQICSDLIFGPWGSFFIYLNGALLQLASVCSFVALAASEEFYRNNIDALRHIYLVGRLNSVFWATVAVYASYGRAP
jgi:hypothetical protein